MRTTAELRRMRRERGEPGGFGFGEGVSLALLTVAIPAMILCGVVAAGVVVVFLLTG